MHPYQRVRPLVGIADHKYAVHGHRRREVRKQRLRVLCTQLISQLLDLRQLRITDAGIPGDLQPQAAQLQGQRNRAENADCLTAALLVRIELSSFTVDADQLALRNQALANGGIEVGKHGAAL
jgi:hypothetical protein